MLEVRTGHAWCARTGERWRSVWTNPPILPGPHSGVRVVCLSVGMLLVAVDLQKDPESGLTVTDDAT